MVRNVKLAASKVFFSGQGVKSSNNFCSKELQLRAVGRRLKPTQTASPPISLA